MRISIFIAAVAVAMTSISVAQADAAAAEKQAKMLCASCHGPNGVSTNPLWPNLAGQQEQYLAKAMTDYREGNRSDINMGPISTMLSDEQIKDLAAYFSGLPAGG